MQSTLGSAAEIKENQGISKIAETQLMLGNEPNLFPYLGTVQVVIRMTF